MNEKLESATDALNKALVQIHTTHDVGAAVSDLADALIAIVEYLETKELER